METNITYIKGELISLAKSGKFDLIAHGCNCFCTQKAGIAKQFADTFGTDKYDLEHFLYKGDINKLGQIEHQNYHIKDNEIQKLSNFSDINLTVINCYTQYNYGTDKRQLDYHALKLCLMKINHIFPDKHIGLPYVIGCGLAGGDPQKVIGIVERTLCDMKVTMVEYGSNYGKLDKKYLK